jgi:hypothetical protein
MTSSKTSSKKLDPTKVDMAREIAWLVAHRKDDVLNVVKNFSRLTRGRRGEFGPPVVYFVSLLKLELAAQKKLARRAAITSSKKKAKTSPKRGVRG